MRPTCSPPRSGARSATFRRPPVSAVAAGTCGTGDNALFWEHDPVRNALEMPRVLLIEDDQRLAEMVSRYLGEAGFAVTHAPTGKRGIALAVREAFDALILDLMLPDMDGLEVCREIRTRADTPILMLTARGDAMDRVVGLEMGADDYLPKPFEPRELLARLKAILRRRGAESSADLLRFGRLQIDPGALEVRLDGEPRTLSNHQLAPLLVLAR